LFTVAVKYANPVFLRYWQSSSNWFVLQVFFRFFHVS